MTAHTCCRCGSSGRLKGRILCGACYEHARSHGTLYRYPRIIRPHDQVAEDAEWLAAAGCDWREASMRLGYQVRADKSPSTQGLRQALKRAGRLDVWKQLREAA